MIITSVQQYLVPMVFTRITAALMGRNVIKLLPQDPHERVMKSYYMGNKGLKLLSQHVMAELMGNFCLVMEGPLPQKL